jgi:hypothetical protein
MDLGSNPAKEIAKLERWLRLSEQFDAALGRLTSSVELSEQLFDTAITPTTTTAPGMSVIKSGAVSGVTQALVDGVSGTYRLDYTAFGGGPEWMAGFRVVPDAAAPATALSLESDSGRAADDGRSSFGSGKTGAGSTAYPPIWADPSGGKNEGDPRATDRDPSLLDPTSDSRNFDTIGSRPYVYFVPMNPDNRPYDRRLMRVPIRITVTAP